MNVEAGENTHDQNAFSGAGDIPVHDPARCGKTIFLGAGSGKLWDVRCVPGAGVGELGSGGGEREARGEAGCFHDRENVLSLGGR